VWEIAATLAIVASLETLLSLEAVDKLDSYKRYSPPNRELLAQGAGNIFAGLLGGLPMTAVIVRSSANVNAGGKTKASSFFHGIFLFVAVIAIPTILNQIPYASLAAILLLTGYKLARIGLFRDMYKAGLDQFIPFMATVVAIYFTDLLKGMVIGMAIGVFYILKRNMHNPFFFHPEEYKTGKPIHIILSTEVSFLNKAGIMKALQEIPVNSHVILDGTKSQYIDYDVLEVIHDFEKNAHLKNIRVELRDIQPIYKVGAH
jgi:MFS superfamily sulfate permease-like transporter